MLQKQSISNGKEKKQFKDNFNLIGVTLLDWLIADPLFLIDELLLTTLTLYYARNNL